MWELCPAPEGYTSQADGVFEDTAKIRFVCKVCEPQLFAPFMFSLCGKSGGRLQTLINFPSDVPVYVVSVPFSICSYLKQEQNMM